MKTPKITQIADLGRRAEEQRSQRLAKPQVSGYDLPERSSRSSRPGSIAACHRGVPLVGRSTLFPVVTTGLHSGPATVTTSAPNKVALPGRHDRAP